MADLYEPGFIPEEYSQEFFVQELNRIAASLQAYETPFIILVPLASEPDKVEDGMIVHADGTNWNPGGGQGIYVYHGGTWNKL